jgi:hypothetical protein
LILLYLRLGLATLRRDHQKLLIADLGKEITEKIEMPAKPSILTVEVA